MQEHCMHVRALTNDERKGMSAERNWINSLLAGVGSAIQLTGTEADIPTLHTLLERGPFTKDAPGELMLLGRAFGDVIACEVGMSWVVVEDESGTDFALKIDTHPVFVFPRSMLLKRIQGGESPSEINLSFMLEQIAKAVQEQVRNAGI
jgi:hypothetical protein